MTSKSNAPRRKYWYGGQISKGQNDAFEAALSSDLWEKGTADDWDAYWYTGMPENAVFERLAPGRTVNHIPGNNGVTVKSLLFDTLDTAKKRLDGHPLAERFDFFPHVYAMPQDYFDLQEAAARDPGKLWIQKPKGLSRGRGIQVLDDAAVAPKGDEWMVQEYLHRPHLYDGHKYVLRCYVVLRSVDPLRVYWYNEGFAKLASEKYSTDPASLKNLFVHLTNPDVNEDNEEASAPVVFISFANYRKWLRDQGHDDVRIFQQLEDLIVLTMMSVRERMRWRMETLNVHADGCYELFGLDCMLDADLKPWILECNLSPSLDVCALPEHGGIDEGRIKRQLVFDLVKMIGANEDVPDWSALEQQDGILAQWEWERQRLGDFRCVYPGNDPARYLEAFPVPRYSDVVLAQQLGAQPDKTFKLVPDQVEEFFLDDALVLYAGASKQFFVPNPTASWIWLQMAEGLAIPDIIHQLAEQTGAPRAQVARDVWDTISDWGHKGLVRHERQVSRVPDEKHAAPDDAWCGRQELSLGSGACTVRYTHAPVGERLRRLAEACPAPGSAANTAIDIVRGAQGYTMLGNVRVVASDVRLSRVVPLLVGELWREQAAHRPDAILMKCAYISTSDKTVMIVGDEDARWDSLACALGSILPACSYGGGGVMTRDVAQLTPLSFPLWLDDCWGAANGDALCDRLLQGVHEMAIGQRVRLMPASTQAGHSALNVHSVVLPDYDPDAATTAERVPITEVMPRLYARRAGSDSDSSQFVDWLNGLPAYRVRFSDPFEAAQSLKAQLALD